MLGEIIAVTLALTVGVPIARAIFGVFFGAAKFILGAAFLALILYLIAQ